MHQQPLEEDLYPSVEPKHESFEDIVVSLSHDPDNPFFHDSLVTAAGLPVPSDAFSLVLSNRTVPVDSTDLSDLPGSLVDISCPVPSVGTVLPGSSEILVPSDPTHPAAPMALVPLLPDAPVPSDKMVPPNISVECMNLPY